MSDLTAVTWSADPVLTRWPSPAPDVPAGLAPALRTVLARQQRDAATAAAIRAYLETGTRETEVDVRL